MTAVAFLDTNILLYTISREPAERAKKAIAVELLDRTDAGLSVQVLQEFMCRRRGRREETGSRMPMPRI